MDRMVLGVLIMLCGVLLGIGGGIAASCKGRAAKGVGIVVSVAAVLGILFFCLRLLVSLKISMLVAAFLCSLMLGAACSAAHLFLTGHVSGRFPRVLLRLLLTLISFAAAVGCIRLMQDKLYNLAVLSTLLLIGVLCLFAVPISLIHNRGRRSKILRSSVMQEALDFCGSHPVVGVQVIKDGIRFFDRLPNAAYCKGERVNSFDPDNPPAHWGPYLRGEGCFYQIRFADRAFPELEKDQLELAAKGLASQLPGFKAVQHYGANTVDKGTHYDSERGARVHTTETTIYVNEWFLFQEAAARPLEQQEKAAQAMAKAIQAAAPKGNTWE